MSEHSFDRVIRRAAGMSRRASLLTLGAAGLTSLASTRPNAAEAKKNKNDKCKKDKKQLQQDLAAVCPTQGQECTNVVTSICGTNPDCQFLFGCCSFLSTCDVTGFFLCLDNPPQPTR